ncbi:imidazole glycerol phosphate synthase subunit HisH [Dokdonia pacifica]|uniref:Imidazole glycerol phosphate synthase subunit HisH n=1 Tax=Dokdonia pacifica TaxID=1627892 RepID=A0A239D909_9FLAO|nr:imidazole glycerol phosphate synthase subunit HisH [Dokdonia pacifica]GGG40485.1 imidazole glycerol phosphate synthase subunit HisH [Dokdonia pacifica]SNS28334.1 glutamine amidotransferase [Dokdonia pacifica]
MKIVIIDYGAGNIQSIKFAIERLGFTATLSDNPEEIRNADKVIFPGVGEASSAMRKLKESGLDSLIPELQQPVLGICLGMQLMCNYSEEGDTEGLKIFDVDVVRFRESVKIPQIQWNSITSLKGPLFENVENNEFIYMVHSYYAPVTDETIAVCEYGIPYGAAFAKANFYGTQFHPEKSSSTGAQILKNFLEL